MGKLALWIAEEKAEREAKAAEMEQKWEDGMSNISDALSDLLDTLSFDLLGTETSAVPEGVPPAAERLIFFLRTLARSEFFPISSSDGGCRLILARVCSGEVSPGGLGGMGSPGWHGYFASL